MRLEGLFRWLLPSEPNNNHENQPEIIRANSLPEFINLLEKEHMTKVEVTSDVAHNGTNYFFSNHFSALNSQKDIKYTETYAKLSILNPTSANIDKRLSATIRTLITAQHRLKLLQLEIPSISTQHLNPQTGKPLTEENLQNIELMKKKYSATPFPISGELINL